MVPDLAKARWAAENKNGFILSTWSDRITFPVKPYSFKEWFKIASNSLLYSEPIDIKQTTVVRARVFETGYIPSYTQSRVYIYNVNHTLPIISLITDPDNLFDNDDVNYMDYL